MYIITEKGYKGKTEVYKDEEILMFEEMSKSYCKVHLKNKKEIICTFIEKLEIIFEGT
jgi:abortive infection bacteriophage resistance protein